MLIVTTNNAPGYRIVNTLGVARGITVRSRNVISDALGGIQSMLGGRVEVYVELAETSRAEALERCGADWSIQGGEPVLGQWLEDSRDHNVTCPGISRDLGRWFAATRGATGG